MGWFYGFKLYAIINPRGELIRFRLTPGNVDNRQTMLDLCKGLFSDTLVRQNLQLTHLTPLKKNMQPMPRTRFEKAIMRRHSLIETVFDELKNLCQIKHTRYRSSFNFLVNLCYLLLKAPLLIARRLAV